MPALASQFLFLAEALTVQPLEVCITYFKNHTQLAETLSSQFQNLFLFFKI